MADEDDVIDRALRTADAIRHPAPNVPEPEPRVLTPQGFYSPAADILRNTRQQKGSPQQFKAMLTKAGVKPDEFKHSRFDETFGSKPSVTRQALKQHFERSVPKLQETTLGEGKSKYHSYALPGAQKYRELLLHLPNEFRTLDQIAKARGYGGWHVGLTPDQQREVEAIQEAGPSQAYKSGHWDIPNVVAHLRMSDRGAGTDKALHLEELQSDWAQEGRKKGFKTPLTPAERDEMERLRQIVRLQSDESPERTRYNELANRNEGIVGIPSAPYVDSTAKWVDLGLKRALHEAAKGGYNRLLVTPGEEQAKRYDLSKHINDVTLHGTGDNMRLSATDKNGRKVIDMQHVTPETLPDYIGKEATEKLLSQPEPNPKNPYAARNLFDADLKVGGEGMKGFYDKIIPQALERLAKKHDPMARMVMHGHELDARRRDAMGRLGSSDEGKSTRVHALEITPQMRASILKGLPAYAEGGAVDDDLAQTHPHKMTPEQLKRWYAHCQAHS